MQTSMIAAGLLAIVIGVVHSVLGERLIFRHLRSRGLVPAKAAPPLRERHIRILWATWHATSIFGCGLGVVLLQLAVAGDDPALGTLIKDAAAAAFLGAALLVFIGTRARHPGWLGLLGVAALAWWS